MRVQITMKNAVNTARLNSKLIGNGINGYCSVRMHDFSNALNIFICNEEEMHPIRGSSSMFVRPSQKCLCHLYTAIYFSCHHFCMLFSASWTSQKVISWGKMQNLMFPCCSKDGISKSNKWNICSVRNDMQLMSTVLGMNSRWLLCVFLSAANLQKRYLPSKEYLCECRRLFREFIDSTLYIY